MDVERMSPKLTVSDWLELAPTWKLTAPAVTLFDAAVLSEPALFRAAAMLAPLPPALPARLIWIPRAAKLRVSPAVVSAATVNVCEAPVVVSFRVTLAPLLVIENVWPATAPL